jgi:hypothetical protein
MEHWLRGRPTEEENEGECAGRAGGSGGPALLTLPVLALWLNPVLMRVALSLCPSDVMLAREATPSPRRSPEADRREA